MQASITFVVFVLLFTMTSSFKEYSSLRLVSSKFQTFSILQNGNLHFHSTELITRRGSFFKHQALRDQLSSINQSYHLVGTHLSMNLTSNPIKDGKLVHERKLINSLIHAANEFTSMNNTRPEANLGYKNSSTGWWFVKSANQTNNLTVPSTSLYTFKNFVTSRENAPKVIASMIFIYFLTQNWVNSKDTVGTQLEVAFSQFLNILSNEPKRFQYIEVLPNALKYILDGKIMYTNRAALLESVLMEKLVSSGVLFRVNPTATPSPHATHSPLYYLSAGYLILLFAKTMLDFALKWWRYWLVFKAVNGKNTSSSSSSSNSSSKESEGEGEEGEEKEGIVGKNASELQLSLQYGNLSFADFAGQETAKSEVKEVCDMLKQSDKYKALGARLPSGVLLVGPPGSGKTLLARITAAEARVPFFACAASDFVEIFVGRGPQRVRRLFAKASQCAPCIVFIDEIDSIGKARRKDGLDSERDSTLNQLLTCMDGLDTSNNGVIVMAATNRIETLDSALLRPGRFDRIVNCPLPDR